MIKNILLTGATSGIGKAAAKKLLQEGHFLILPYRNEEKATALKKELEAIAPERFDLQFCDLASFESIRAFAAYVKNTYPHIDVLINNAGVWNQRFRESKDGIELTFAVNHLAPFLLTNLLLDLLRKAERARVVNVSSDLHQGSIDFDDIEFRKKEYNGIAAYRQSKLANILFTKELARRLQDEGITANALMPGFIATNIFQDLNFFARLMIKIMAKSPEKGAETIVYLALSPEVEGITGKYFKDKKEAISSRQSQNIELAKRLWAVSEQMTGLHVSVSE
ncbi:MAG: retinol dehydrogenase [Thermonema sp.]|uniref:SDR family oxidoreductase n=1 Tax=Thermonema sp. TaxID=2231181 RepID=UPI0021DDE55C|nr:SDR family oxidoreductase [Thermonema sp.]GIV38523.1 MAG: retinol dehydrogenase [Thermonema sp.]